MIELKMFHSFGKYLTDAANDFQFSVTDTPNKPLTNKTQQIKIDNLNYFKTSA